MRRAATSAVLGMVMVFLIAGPAAACGALIGANGSVDLLRTSTLAAYSEGVEHYVTVFDFAGGGAKFGSIVPLPGIPSDVKKGGAWTLQRLTQEVTPVRRDLFNAVASDAGGAAKASVIMTANVDALDITIVKGGGDAIGEWAKEQGFRLTPDSPEVLDFYAQRSPVFMAVAFDSKRASELGRVEGEGIPVHLSIPTHDPWVPLRILGLGKGAAEKVEADVFLLTPNEPRLLPVPDDSRMTLERSEPASPQLLADLRSDRGMRWLPDSDMWLSYLEIDAKAGALTHDLAIDPTGVGAPSPVAAGLVPPLAFETPTEAATTWIPWAVALSFGAAVLWGVDRLIGPGWPKV